MNYLAMKATNWEFTKRAIVFGLIFGLAFPLYAFDHENSTAALANRLAPKLGINADPFARLLFGLAAILIFLAAFIRTWASAYLHANVVYAREVKTQSLIADGPYRYVRNPLYFANVLMVIGMGAMMSRTGFFVALLAMSAFCYRLILREESELQSSRGQDYERYRNAVPRLWPSLWPRVASAGRQPDWAAGFKAEAWYWGLGLAVLVFGITLKMALFFIIFAVSMALFWLSSSVLAKKPASPTPASHPSAEANLPDSSRRI